MDSLKIKTMFRGSLRKILIVNDRFSLNLEEFLCNN